MKLDHNDTPTRHKRIHRIGKREVNLFNLLWLDSLLISSIWVLGYMIWHLILYIITSTCNYWQNYFMSWTYHWSYQLCSLSNLIRFDASYILYQIRNISYTNYKILILGLISYKKIIRYKHECIRHKFLVKYIFT